MDKAEFRAALKRNQLTCVKFAELTRSSVSQVYAWGGTYPVPHYARFIIQLLDDRGGAYGLQASGGAQPYAKHNAIGGAGVQASDP